MHKFLKTALMEAVGPLDTGVAMAVAAHLVRLLRVVVLLALWRMIFAQKGVVSGMTMDTVLTYTLIASAFADQLDVRTGVPGALWRGSIAIHFVRPMGLFRQFAAQTFGSWIMPFLIFSVPVILAAPLFGVHAMPADLSAGCWFVPSLALAISAGFAIDFTYASLMVAWGQNLWVVVQIRSAVGLLLSGAVIPLALFPWGIGRAFDWLPFAATASAPLRVYAGTGDPFALLTMQVAWNLVLWPMAIWMWRVNRERLVCYGG
jgi:ABC-2 type transport system permease protein